MDDKSLTGYHFLTGKLIISMPYAPDPRFTHSVIYVCGHDSTGAMGLIINKPLSSVSFSDLLEQMSIPHGATADISVYYGGPVEVGRGFVLHSSDYITDSTVFVSNDFALTATMDILRAINHDIGPQQSMLALGYVGWDSGRLEQEIQENHWLIIEATPDLVFSHDKDNLWRASLSTIGVNPDSVSLEIGHA